MGRSGRIRLDRRRPSLARAPHRSCTGGGAQWERDAHESSSRGQAEPPSGREFSGLTWNGRERRTPIRGLVSIKRAASLSSWLIPAAVRKARLMCQIVRLTDSDCWAGSSNKGINSSRNRQPWVSGGFPSWMSARSSSFSKRISPILAGWNESTICSPLYVVVRKPAGAAGGQQIQRTSFSGSSSGNPRRTRRVDTFATSKKKFR
jgi:hypothetical protein